MRRVAIQLALIAVVLPAPSAHPTTYSIPVPAETKLDNLRLPRDVSSLIKYLEFGIPPDHVPLVHGSPKQSTLVFNRFNYYVHSVDALAKLDDPRAIPALKKIQVGRLPPLLQADLDMAAAAYDLLTSWEDWKLFEDICHARLVLRATVAIELISGESQAEFLRSMLKVHNGRLMTTCDNRYLQTSLSALQADIAEEALKSGSTAGVDSMIQLLNSPDPEVRERAAHKLREWTNQLFGPYEDSPKTTLWRDVRQWEMWWAVSRNSVDPVGLLPEPNKIPRPPQGRTLRDRLRNSILAEREHWNDNGDREWVYVHAREHLDELRTIALDPHERYGIRVEAIGVIRYEDRNLAFDLAVSCMRDPSGGHALYSPAVRMVRGYPNRSAEVLRKCIAEGWPAAYAAISMVAQDQNLRPLLLELLPTLSGDARKSAVDMLVWVQDPPGIAFNLALAGEDVGAALVAVRKIEAKGVEASLSPEARRDVARWVNNPEFQHRNVRWTNTLQNKEEKFAEAMISLNPADPRAASLFALAMREIGGQEASDGFVRCVEYYRTLEGRGWTLADLGYK